MQDEGVIIVGVPGMGNSEPSWHQRQPFGFSKKGRGRAQARMQTLRRPSTAYARLGGEHTEAQLRNALESDRTSYWGLSSSGGRSGGAEGENSSQDFIVRGVPTPHCPPQRTSTGMSFRARPATAGHQRSASIGAVTQSDKPLPCTMDCTRNRAGIIRNGRGGRPAPPPTPPPASPPPQSTAPVSDAPTPSPPRLTQEHLRRHRPSTAGSTRPSVLPFNATAPTPRAADDFAQGQNVAPRHGVEVGGRVGSSSPLIWSPTRGGSGRTPGKVASYDWDDASIALKEEVTTVGGGSANAAAIPRPLRPTGPSENQLVEGTTACKPNSYHHSGRGRTQHRNTDRYTQSRELTRPRPASAAPARTTCTKHDAAFDGYGSDGVGNGSWGDDGYHPRSILGACGSGRSVEGVRWGAGGGEGRGRPENRSQKARPRSASAAGTRTHGWKNLWNRERVKGTPPRDLDRQGCPSTAAVPKFVASEKQVLRFFGHLSEELAWGYEDLPREDAPRALKIRQVVVTLFLADGSIEIFETRQGVDRRLIRNATVLLPQVGTDFKLLGKSFRLTDCDDYTRNWYSSKGFLQPEAEAVPEQINECLRVEHTTGLGTPFRPRTADSRPSTAGRSTAKSPARQARQEQGRRFHTHDRQVLRFKSMWDDSSKGGIQRRFDLLFYLQDKTVALYNARDGKRNSGRDEGSVYVRRQRLPIDWRLRDNQTDGDNDTENSHVNELDLFVGGAVNVWGRKIRLLGCDPFTKEYYRREHGIHMESDVADAATERARHRALRMYRRPGTADQQQHAQHQQRGEVARRPTPQQLRQEMDYSHSGGVASIGSRGRDSTIGGAFPPDRYRGHRIRCKAVLMSDHPNDIGREFVITYDLGLDTLMVYELQRRNSGRPGGLFLRKGKHRRPTRNGTGRYYASQDLFLGATVPLASGHTLLVIEMDRASLTLCEEFPQEFPLMDCERILGRIATRARQMRLDLRSELRRRAEKAWAASTAAAPSSNHELGTRRASPSVRPPPASMAMLAGRTAGKGFVGGKAPRQFAQHNDRNNVDNLKRSAAGCRHTNTTSDGGGGGGGREGNDRSVGVAGRRGCSGATWGLVGGWGDCSGRYLDGGAGRTGGGRYNDSNFQDAAPHKMVSSAGPTAAPWATVEGVPTFSSADAGAGQGIERGRAVADTGQGVITAFEGERAFRDAMDGLGLLVGLGQQEVLTLVRAFIDHEFDGRRVSWASMCDRISQISSAAQSNSRTVGIDSGPLPSGTVSDNNPCGARASSDHVLLKRMRDTGVAWRRIFASKEALLTSNKYQVSPACDRSDQLHLHSAGILGVASLVKAMRRNGMEVEAGDASLLARQFVRGEGSQVDYNSLCDAIYPCNFAATTAPHSDDCSDSSNNADGVHVLQAATSYNNVRNPKHDLKGADFIVDDDAGGSKGRRPWSLWDRDDHAHRYGRPFGQIGGGGSDCWGDERRHEGQHGR